MPSTTAGPADVSLGAGAAAVVSRDSGTVWATTASGQLHRIRLGGQAGEPIDDQVVGTMNGQDAPADGVDGGRRRRW